MSARRRWIVALAIAVATTAVYAQTLSSDFVELDDRKYVPTNAWVEQGLTPESVGWAFTTFYFSNWHPLTWLSYQLDAELFGVDPAGFHATNVALHVLNAVLLLGVLEFLTGRLAPSALVAGLFALHPLNVESVAWIAERKNVLSTAFGLLSLWAYASYAMTQRRSRYFLCALLLALGLMAKPMLVSWPLLCLLLDHWPLQRTAWARRWPPVGAARAPVCPEASWTRLLLEKLPLLALCLASSVLTLLAQTRAIESAAGIALPLRIANAVVACVRYLGKALWPFDLSLIYPHPYLPGGTPWSAGQITGSALLLIGISALALRWHRRPYLITGWLWYAASLIPVLGLVQVGYAGMADRYAYVPLIGIFVLLAWAAADAVDALGRRQPRAAKPAVALAVLVIVAYAVRSADQVAAWRDSESLYRRSLASTPDSVRLQQKLGTLLLHRGESRDARDHLREAVRLWPGWYAAAQNLAWLQATHPDPEIRDPASALELARIATAGREDRDANVLDTLAAAHAAAGEFDDAVKVASRALAIARERGDPAMAAAIESRLRLYEVGQAYFEGKPE